MKRTEFGTSQRIVAHQRSASLAPLCLTCGRDVDGEELVEGEPGTHDYARVLVRHHGAEELRTFRMGTIDWSPDELASRMRGADWFDPRVEAGGDAVARTAADRARDEVRGA